MRKDAENMHREILGLGLHVAQPVKLLWIPLLFIAVILVDRTTQSGEGKFRGV